MYRLPQSAVYKLSGKRKDNKKQRGSEHSRTVYNNTANKIMQCNLNNPPPAISPGITTLSGSTLKDCRCFVERRFPNFLILFFLVHFCCCCCFFGSAEVYAFFSAFFLSIESLNSFFVLSSSLLLLKCLVFFLFFSSSSPFFPFG